MKYLRLIAITSIILAFTAPAFGFITVIDVGDRYTIMPGGWTMPKGLSLTKIEGEYLSYRGLKGEAKMWFEAFVRKSGAKVVHSEMNEETGTISIVISIDSHEGVQYDYFIIKKG